MFRYQLRTLLILLAVGPPVCAAWFYGAGALEYIAIAMIVAGMTMVVAGARIWATSIPTGNGKASPDKH